MRKFLCVKGEPDVERRGCKDCRFLQGAVTLWCMNAEACKARGTATPGAIECDEWQPMLKPEEISFLDRIFGDYIKVDLTDG